MSISDLPTEHIGPVLPPSAKARPLQRLAVVRRQQGVSLRRVARQLRADVREVRAQEDETCDLLLSTLYKWQEALDVPVAELLVDVDAPLSPPVLERARMIKLMKTAAAILEKSDNLPIRRMTETLVGQLLEMMPELAGVSPWHAVGQRRTLDELGRAVERGLGVGHFYDT